MNKATVRVDVTAMPHVIAILDGNRLQSLTIVIFEGLAFRIAVVQDEPTVVMLLLFLRPGIFICACNLCECNFYELVVNNVM